MPILKRVSLLWKRVKIVWKNEYGNIFRDKGVLLIFFGAMLIYPLVYPLPYLHENIRDISVAVVDKDNTQLSRQISRMMDANEALHVKKKYTDLESARKDFFEGTVYGIIMIPKDFSKKITRGELSNIVAYCDASYLMIYRQVLTGAKTVALTMSAGVEIKKLMLSGMTREEAMAAYDPLPVVSYPLFNPRGGYASFVVPGVLILILQQTLLVGIGMIMGTARENGELEFYDEEREIVETILGKAGAYLSIYAVHVIYFYTILYKLFSFPKRASMPELLFFALPFLLACIFLAITISAFFKNRETSMMILLCTSIPALFLSGFSWPVQAIPDWLHFISYLLPTTAGIDGFLKLNQMGAGLGHVSFNLVILWGIALFYFVTACLSMRHIMKKSGN